MDALIQACFLLGLAGGPAQPEVTYGFAASDSIVKLTIRFLNPPAGRRLVFYSSAGPEEPGPRFRQFVGAAAIVTYRVQPPKASAIREHVTLLDQSADLPERAAFSKRQALVEGAASDLQVFGYDEAVVEPQDRGRIRAHMRAQWRVYRQKLYLDEDEKPFAVIEWKHTLQGIGLVRIYAPPEP